MKTQEPGEGGNLSVTDQSRDFASNTPVTRLERCRFYPDFSLITQVENIVFADLSQPRNDSLTYFRFVDFYRESESRYGTLDHRMFPAGKRVGEKL